MGYNRSGKRRTDRLKRHRREMRRLATKPAAATLPSGKQIGASKR
jgi:hypothetical protein